MNINELRLRLPLAGFLRWLLFLVALGSDACPAEHQGFVPKGDAWSDWFVPGKPQVIETGIEIERWNGSNQFTVEWLNDRRIAFSELIDSGMYEDYDNLRNSIPMPRDYLQIVLYDTVSGSKEVYKQGDLICLKNGRIAYRIVAPSKTIDGATRRTTLLYGDIEKEKVHVYQQSEMLNRFDCEIQKKRPDDKTGTPIRYLKRADGKVFELPFLGSYLRSAEWLEEYWRGYGLRVYSTDSRKKDDPVMFYFLKPTGEIYFFPRALNAERDIGWRITYIPTRTGAVTMEQQLIRMNMPGRSGIYVDDGNLYRRYQRGFVGGGYADLSPTAASNPLPIAGHSWSATLLLI